MLFVLPPATSDGQKVIPSHHPIMTATLAAVAVEEGAHVGVIDAALLGLGCKELAQLILEWGAQWVGFVPFEYRRELPLDTVLKTAEEVRRVNESIHIGVLNASWGALSPRRAVEQNQISFASFGDGEPAIRSFARMEKRPARGVLWNISGYLEDNPSRPVVAWDKLPVPAWYLFDHTAYIPSAHRYRLLPTLPVFASRSCPYGCDFCPQSLFNPSQKHSSRAPDHVYQEVEALVTRYGIRELEFYDPTFGIRREDALILCEKLQGLDLSWSCYTRCDLVDEELIEAMAKSGCHTILFGVESADEQVRNRTNKELERVDIERAFKLCKEYKISTIASFIIGLPKESKQTIQRTLLFARELNPTFAQFHLARSFFDHEQWQDLGDVAEDWKVSDASVNGKAYIPKGFSQEELEKWLLKSYISFYLRPQKLLQLMLQLHSKEDIKRHLRGVYQIARHTLG